VTKVLGEEMVRRYVDLYGLGAVILRYCWVFGAGDVLDLFTTQTWEEFMSPEQRVAPQRRSSIGPEASEQTSRSKPPAGQSAPNSPCGSFAAADASSGSASIPNESCSRSHRYS
jgi:hypothetical protein